ILYTLVFAAHQRRKLKHVNPYMNQSIRMMDAVIQATTTDSDTLRHIPDSSTLTASAALLHDLVDKDSAPDLCLEFGFGTNIANILTINCQKRNKRETWYNMLKKDGVP